MTRRAMVHSNQGTLIANPADYVVCGVRLPAITALRAGSLEISHSPGLRLVQA
jgi:hypothetical protein